MINIKFRPVTSNLDETSLIRRVFERMNLIKKSSVPRSKILINIVKVDRC